MPSYSRRVDGLVFSSVTRRAIDWISTRVKRDCFPRLIFGQLEAGLSREENIGSSERHFAIDREKHLEGSLHVVSFLGDLP